MNTLTKIVGLTTLSLACVVAACGGDDEGTGGSATGATTGGGGTNTGTTGGGGTNTGTGGDGGGGNPSAPTLGTQIDRMGRAAIATATYERFTDGASHDAAVDTWNQDADPGNWGTYVTSVAAQIAILDGLETTCGNQLLNGVALADPQPTCPDDGNVACYGTFATVLSNDWIIIKLNGADGNGYLGVESNFIAQTGDSRGGRIPADDVIESSYTVLAGVPFDDGVVAPAQSQVELFPYLAAPN